MNDEEQIRATVQTYFDCMYESSAEKTHAAFHPSARITGYLDDGLHEMTVKDFAVRVRDDYLGMTFMDTLSLLKTDDKWSIYNKLFHVEGAAG